jgi:hypothetical protein
MKGRACKISEVKARNISIETMDGLIGITVCNDLMGEDGVKLGESKYVVLGKEVLDAAEVFIKAIEKDAASMLFDDSEATPQLESNTQPEPTGDIIDILRVTNSIPERFKHLEHTFSEWDIE